MRHFYLDLCFAICISACSSASPDVVTPGDKVFSVQERLIFTDGTTAQLNIDVKDTVAQATLINGNQTGLSLEGKVGQGLRLTTPLCFNANDFAIDLPAFPDSISGSIGYQGTIESFQPTAESEKMHPVDGTWAFSATYGTSATQTVYNTGSMPISRHGALLFATYDGYAWESTQTVEMDELITIPEKLVCNMVGHVAPSGAFEFLGIHGIFASDFTSAVMWADNATGVATRLK